MYVGCTQPAGDVRGVRGGLVGLRYEGGLRWRIHFFDFDLGTIEVASLNGVVSTVAVSSVNRDDRGGTAGVNPQEGADEGAAVSA